VSQIIAKLARRAALEIYKPSVEYDALPLAGRLEVNRVARIIRQIFTKDTRLTLAQLNQLQAYVDTRDEPDRGGWYYGNREHFETRHAAIKEWLAQEIERASGPPDTSASASTERLPGQASQPTD